MARVIEALVLVLAVAGCAGVPSGAPGGSGAAEAATTRPAEPSLGRRVPVEPALTVELPVPPLPVFSAPRERPQPLDPQILMSLPEPLLPAGARAWAALDRVPTGDPFRYYVPSSEPAPAALPSQNESRPTVVSPSQRPPLPKPGAATGGADRSAQGPAAQGPEPQGPAASRPTAVVERPAPAAPLQPAETAPAASQILARPGDDVEIALAGEGWVLVGVSEPKVAELRSRGAEAGRSVFVFRGGLPGSTRLEFQRQDHSSGRQVRSSVEIGVIGDGEWRARVEGLDAPTPPAVDRPYIERLIRVGRLQEALDELRATYRADSHYHNDRIGGILSVTGQDGAAREYWMRNLPATADAPMSEFEERAVAAMVAISARIGDHRGLLARLDQFLKITGLVVEEESLLAAGSLAESGDGEAALELLERFQSRYPRSSRMDELFYQLARLYEGEGALRDLPRSRDMYLAVSRGFPESPLSAAAEQRVRYLERHFLHIR